MFDFKYYVINRTVSEPPQRIATSLLTWEQSANAGSYPMRHSHQGRLALESREYGDIFLSIVERTGAGLAVLDPQLRIQEANAAFREQCGAPSADLCDQYFTDLLHPSVRTHMQHRLERLVQGADSRFTQHAAVQWAARLSSSSSLTVAAIYGDRHSLKSLVVVVTTEGDDVDQRAAVRPQRMVTSMDARILEGIAIGTSAVQLASKLYLSRQGIEYHVGRMLRRFRVPNRAALISKACAMGIFGVGVWPPKVLPEFVMAIDADGSPSESPMARHFGGFRPPET